MSPTRAAHWYNELETSFPNLHYVFATLVSSPYYKVPVDSPILHPDDDAESLHRKQRNMLFALLGLIRTRNRNLLRHWAIVEPLALWFKGYRQPNNARSNGTSATLNTCWQGIEAIRSRCLPTFQEKLQCEPRCHGAFDNFNMVTSKQTTAEGKSAITHIGTSSLVKEDRPYILPVGTKMSSPLGTKFRVVGCTDHSDTRVLVIGQVENDSLPEGTEIADRALIEEGFLYPEVGWLILDMPGFTARPPVTLLGQVVPPPLRAWVKSSLSDAEIAMGQERGFTTHEDDEAVSLSTLRMQRIQQMCQRLVQMRSQAFRYQHRKKESEQALNDYVWTPETPSPPKLVEYGATTKSFLNFIDDVSVELQRANTFQHDLVSWVNPRRGSPVDRMFSFEIAPYCETKMDGMKKVFYRLGEYFQLFTMDKDGQVHCCKNWDKRKIHLCVDGLSSRNWRLLKIAIAKKLTTMGSFKSIMPLLLAYDRFTCQHDYLHENRFHKQDVIWRTKYGCFLQAFQVHLGSRKLTGNPVKKNMQGHELFLFVVEQAIRTRRFDCFLSSCNEKAFAIEGSKLERLRKLDELFNEYCKYWETCPDEPTRVCALFLKDMDSYHRGVDATKKEIPGC